MKAYADSSVRAMLYEKIDNAQMNILESTTSFVPKGGLTMYLKEFAFIGKIRH